MRIIGKTGPTVVFEAGLGNEQVRNAGSFPAVPLTVIAATDHGPFFRPWEPVLMELQHQLAALSQEARLIVAWGSGHDVQTDGPALVVPAMRSLVSEVAPLRRGQGDGRGEAPP